MSACEENANSENVNYSYGFSIISKNTILGKNVNFNGMRISGCGLVTIGDNFHSGKAKLRMITGHRYKTEDLNIFTKLFSEKFTKSFEGKFIKNSKIQKLQNIVNNGQIELKIAIPNSELIADEFSERIGIFIDEEDEQVAFTGTSKESFSSQTRDFESVDVFTSWNDKTRVERKVKDFEDLWQNKTKYVDVCDFMYAEENNLLKYSSKWITQI